MSYKFLGNVVIKGTIYCETGLHMGGIVEGFEIGGMDNPVIRDSVTGYPYIPGSSLKGKMRSLLEWNLEKVFIDEKSGEAPPHSCDRDPEIVEKTKELENLKGDEREKKEKEIEEMLQEMLQKKMEDCPICRVFGTSAEKARTGPTRLVVRDCWPSKDTREEIMDFLEKERGLPKAEWKMENVIDRVLSQAMPRTMERIPKDSEFRFEMIYAIYDIGDGDKDFDFLKYVFSGMKLLEDSYLGGSGTRGYGKIKFGRYEENEGGELKVKKGVSVEFRPKEFYETGDVNKIVRIVREEDKKTPKEIIEEFDTLIKPKLQRM